jgi:hypothetical protein
VLLWWLLFEVVAAVMEFSFEDLVFAGFTAVNTV